MDMPKQEARQTAPVSDWTVNPLKGFMRDQIEAVKVAREEKVGEDRDKAANRRENACHLAMRYFDCFGAGIAPSVQKVIETAREFEKFLLEP
jgi:hypothetical protein